jgi:hypothetical protein
MGRLFQPGTSNKHYKYCNSRGLSRDAIYYRYLLQCSGEGSSLVFTLSYQGTTPHSLVV